MNQLKHTPGPWSVFAEEGETVRPGIDSESQEEGGAGFSIIMYGDAEDECGIHGRTDEEAEANARLVAAAPDMLEALRLCVQLQDLGAVDAARAAIAKATRKKS